MSFAKITVSGNLGSDAETKYTPSGTMLVAFTIAVNDSKDKEAPATWYRITAWGDLANRLDGLAQRGFLNKGSGLVVFGRFNPRNWTDAQGEVKTSFDVTADSFEFVGGGQRKDQNATPANNQPSPATDGPAPTDFDSVPF